METSVPSEYYLQVVLAGEKPVWPHDEGDLIIGSKQLEEGFVQYWAYLKGSGKSPHTAPRAETTAAQHVVSGPIILIDQPQSSGSAELELILSKDGHAWGKTESNVANLEDNLSSILELAHKQFQMRVENFLTTKNVTADVEKVLDDLASETKIESSHPVQSNPLTEANVAMPRQSGSSKKWVILPIALIIIIFGAIVYFREEIIAKLNNSQASTKTETIATVTPTPQLTPTPTPISLDRSQYQVRVLNGTTQNGEASKLADKLKEMKWQILKVGNATNSATPKTLVRVKSKTQEAGGVMVSDLASDLSATISADLKSQDKADIEVVIGKE